MKPVDTGAGNLISSQLQSGGHSPILDLDFEAKLIPSSTPGRYHLYLDGVEMTDSEYQMLIECLVRVGVLEKGILRQYREKGGTFARPPWITKPKGDKGSR